jgi:hypothetical protein
VLGLEGRKLIASSLPILAGSDPVLGHVSSFRSASPQSTWDSAALPASGAPLL